MQMNEKFGALSLSEHFNLSNLTQFYYFDVELGPYWPLAQVKGYVPRHSMPLRLCASEQWIASALWALSVSLCNFLPS
jgi:hypothetical protein